MKKSVKTVKLLVASIIAMSTLSLVGCGSSDSTDSSSPDSASESTADSADSSSADSTTPEIISISVQNGEGNMIDIDVETNPEKIVCVDYVSFDMLASWGMTDKIVGGALDSMPPHLAEYVSSDMAALGGLKEVDMEGLMSLQPDLIFTSGRLASEYESFAPIASTVMNNLDYVNQGSWNSFVTLAERNASIVGMSDVVATQINDFEERLNALKELASGKTAVVAITSGGTLSTLGNESRCSLIGNEIGFENIADGVDSSHGNASSFEVLVDLDPEYIFILDRDAAIGTEGASPAEQLMDNELVHMTQAYQNDKIIYLDPSAWYLAEGGIIAMDIMLTDVEKAFYE